MLKHATLQHPLYFSEGFGGGPARLAKMSWLGKMIFQCVYMDKFSSLVSRAGLAYQQRGMHLLTGLAISACGRKLNKQNILLFPQISDRRDPCPHLAGLGACSFKHKILWMNQCIVLSYLGNKSQLAFRAGSVAGGGVFPK